MRQSKSNHNLYGKKSMKRERSDVEMRGFAGEPSQKSGSYHTGHQFTLA